MNDIYVKLMVILDKISPFIKGIASKCKGDNGVNVSPVVAGLIDLGEGFYKIYFDYLNKLISNNLNKDEQYKLLFDIEDELFNHLLPHITDMKGELRKIISGLE